MGQGTVKQLEKDEWGDQGARRRRLSFVLKILNEGSKRRNRVLGPLGHGKKEVQAQLCKEKKTRSTEMEDFAEKLEFGKKTKLGDFGSRSETADL